MAEKMDESSQIQLTLYGIPQEAERRPLPRLLQDGTRAGDGAADPFLAEAVGVREVFQLAATARGESEEAVRQVLAGDALLALEAADGTTLFMRADKLREDLERLFPDEVKAGQLDLSLLRDRAGAARGLGDWFWSSLSVLELRKDAIIDAARKKALEWATEKLGALLGDKLQEVAEAGASWLGAKALMWAIESQLAGEPGLYRWKGEALQTGDRMSPDGEELRRDAAAGPALLFIHGTGSHTYGGFKDLYAAGSRDDWDKLVRPFQDRVYGFEHRTFSESPIDNALMLARALPKGTKLSIVTHSRGGLVGDLLCLGGLDEELIRTYRRDPPPGEDEGSWQKIVREQVAAEEQQKLRDLRDLLNEKAFVIDRYVRVACPAQGTTLLSDNLDLFLSGLLSLMNKLVGAVAGPGASPVLSALKRIVLEIAHKRVDPRLVPGIEAMLADSPLGALLALAPRKQGIRMAVIAGDVEMETGLFKRIGVMLTDWMFFDSAKNDLVVDTSSMYGGLASRDTLGLFDDGPEVNHFHYFFNVWTRRAVRDWLTDPEPDKLPGFQPLVSFREPSVPEVEAEVAGREAQRGKAAGDRPIVILLPGIMGSHLKVPGPRGGDRIWLDPLDLIRGGLDEIRFGSDGVEPDGLFEMFYGELAQHLEDSHRVLRFDYDWRLPIEGSADKLAAVVQDQLGRFPNQPVRLLAHSMGGLVVRAMLSKHPRLWAEVVAREGGRLIMLGTPNNGSHLMVQTLLGKADTVRMLARMDVKHRLQGVLDIVGGFPGALQLLPRPGFKDSGNTENDYFQQAIWAKYKPLATDRWFGDGMVATPLQPSLDGASAIWRDILQNNQVDHPERVAYVFGQSEDTPCGVKVVGQGDAARLKIEFTSEGDGSVTWASGRMDNLYLPEDPQRDRCWYMPESHGDLTRTREHFGAIVELLEKGTTALLARLPVSRGLPAPTRLADAGPVLYPTPDDLARSIYGAKARRVVRGRRSVVKVRVRAMDLSHAQLPVLCGHYLGDPISGAERVIDRLVGGALSQRERLGVYAGEIGTSAVVLNHKTREDVRRGTGKGAVIVGLGEFDSLGLVQLTETVRAGVLRLLLHNRDLRSGNDAAAGPSSLKLASLLIGQNSTTYISVPDSIDAVVLGVCEANRQYGDATGSDLMVSELEFVELYLDTAITAAHAVLDLPERLDKELRRLSVEIRPERGLIRGKGVRERLSVSPAADYWPRLIITDADRTEAPCPPHCDQVRNISPTLEDALERLLKQAGCSERSGDAARGVNPYPDVARPVDSAAPVAERLKYVYLSERARAEALALQRQPGLIEALIRSAIAFPTFNRDISHTLFQLMVPLELKAAARQTEKLVLVVDEYTANLPWEMFVVDGEPMVLRTRMVRQLVSAEYRQVVRSSVARTACVIGNPSTEGFYKDPNRKGGTALPSLAEANTEAEAVRDTLEKAGYAVEYSQPGKKALDVLGLLFKKPYRVLTIAAHGVFASNEHGRQPRTGVVLSDGVLLTAAEIGQMEVVPDVVFINCCHLGQITLSSHNRLAASVARELIQMGVRCVVAAGWAVNDQAAKLFSETFFSTLVHERKPFGQAVWAARKATYGQYPNLNTWGAYQAYGDPGYVLDPTREAPKRADGWQPVAPEEVVQRLRAIKPGKRADVKGTVEAVEQVMGRVPAGWRDLPEIQAVLGAVYGELGSPGFDRASKAYVRAIAEEDKQGRVPVAAIEQLANLEAREGERRGGPEGIRMIDRAIERLTSLLAATGHVVATPTQTPEVPSRPNAERWSILGSAYKCKAALLGRRKTSWSRVKVLLEKSRDAYAHAASKIESADFNPYPTINLLQLDAVLFPTDSVGAPTELAHRCQKVARQRFAESYDFFDAVMAADAEVAICLIDGSLPTKVDELKRVYDQAVAGVPTSSRQFDSVVKQLRLMADWLELRSSHPGEKGSRPFTEALRDLAANLDPQAPAASAHAGVESGAGPKGAAVGRGTPEKAAPKRRKPSRKKAT